MTIQPDLVAGSTAGCRRQTRIVEYLRVRLGPGRYETCVGWWHGEQSGEHG
jgi:hypothetical protein